MSTPSCRLRPKLRTLLHRKSSYFVPLPFLVLEPRHKIQNSKTRSNQNPCTARAPKFKIPNLDRCAMPFCKCQQLHQIHVLLAPHHNPKTQTATNHFRSWCCNKPMICPFSRTNSTQKPPPQSVRLAAGDHLHRQNPRSDAPSSCAESDKKSPSHPSRAAQLSSMSRHKATKMFMARLSLVAGQSVGADGCVECAVVDVSVDVELEQHIADEGWPP